jgi:hypothetical protein
MKCISKKNMLATLYSLVAIQDLIFLRGIHTCCIDAVVVLVVEVGPDCLEAADDEE